MSIVDDRLKGYARPLKSVQGAGRDQKNLDYWAKRATENSQLGTRAKSRMAPHPTGKKIVERNTSMRPKVPRKVNAAMRGDV